MSVVWASVFVVLLVIELATLNLVTIWFAIGALFALFVSFFIESEVIQILTFILVSVFVLVITKPIMKKVRAKEYIATNSDRVLGSRGIVLEEIKKYHPGKVKVLGSIWTAVSDEEISVSSEVVVKSIEGVKLRVEKFKNN